MSIETKKSPFDIINNQKLGRLEPAGTLPSAADETEKKTNDYVLRPTTLKFLQKGYIEGRDLLLPQPKTVNIHCYPNAAAREKFNFSEHGLQFCKLPNDLLGSIDELGMDIDNTEKLSQVFEEITSFLSSWAKENGISGVPIPLFLNYRTENPKDDKALKPFDFVHVDFYKEDLKDAMQFMKPIWIPHIEKKFGKLSEEKYSTLVPETMVNLWASLNRRPAQNTLALMDTSSVEDIASKLHPVVLQKFTSASLAADPAQRWVVQEGITRGDAVFFDSTKTPHTGATIVDPEVANDVVRESFEIRIAFFKDHTQT